VVDCLGDVAAVAAHLGIGRFPVTGGSGGGPHRMAAAARLGERVVRALWVSRELMGPDRVSDELDGG
jgi:hypothetical protein